MTIRNDATRLTIRTVEPRRHRSVVGRQGQVLLDADLDQQAGHLLDRIDTGTTDVLGGPGRLVVPAGTNGFRIGSAPTPADCPIGAGHGYLGGWLLENAEPCTLATQPHPRADITPVAPVLIALKALVRHIDPVEEVALADPGLGDAQASGRSLVDWQVFPFAPTAGWGAPFGCAAVAADAEWQALIAPSTGTLAVVPDASPPADDPCSLSPQGGFSRGENLLYRLEVHDGTVRADLPAADGPRFGLAGLRIKLSRRNASVMARITDVDGTEISVTPPALDPLNWFAPGTFAELVSVHDDVDPRDAAAAERLFAVAMATDDVVTLEDAAAPLAASIAGQPGWFLRLWDGFPGGAKVATVSTAADPDRSQLIDLGDGLKVQLGGGATAAVFRRGDHWTFAARSDGSIDWPAGNPFERPHGPVTRYASLAALTPPEGAPDVEDCRLPSAALTDRALLYRGGDGQAVLAPVGGGAVTLPSRLRVAVMRGRSPVVGAAVEWEVPAAPPGTPASLIDGTPVGGGNTVVVVTGPDGLCAVDWAIDGGQPAAVHRVQASLVTAAGQPSTPPLVFTASFRTAAGTGYQPGACTLLQGASTVQEALDTLCQNIGGASEPDTLGLEAIRLFSEKSGVIDLLSDDLILNGLEVRFDAFDQGIAVGVEGGPIEATPEPFDPIVEVELDLPYPTTDPDKVYWSRASFDGNSPWVTAPFGFQRIRLDGTVVVTDDNGEVPSGLLWQPSEQTRIFLASMPVHRCGDRVVMFEDELNEREWKGDPTGRVLCRLRVRSAHVWSRSERTGEIVYLNAEHLGTSAGITNRELVRKERDPQRAADLEMFFYLVLDQ